MDRSNFETASQIINPRDDISIPKYRIGCSGTRHKLETITIFVRSVNDPTARLGKCDLVIQRIFFKLGDSAIKISPVKAEAMPPVIEK